MKGVRFYLEFPSRSVKKRSGKGHKGHKGNVFAAFYESTRYAHYNQNVLLIEGLGSVYDEPNSPVAGTSAAWPEFFDNCKRIPEGLARKIHPELFRRLDENTIRR